MSQYDKVQEQLRERPRRWLVTGVAGFIGSHLLETLLRLGQTVVGIDNFATGKRENLADVLGRVDRASAERFRFLSGDVRDPLACRAATQGAEIVLHEAALGSVPRSMADPASTHAANVDGFLNVLLAAREAGVERVVYASSSSVYGDDASDFKSEDVIGAPLSPYAATKRIDELYAATLARTHGIESVGLRYFNVFGPRQDPEGAYAAVVPRWIAGLLTGQRCVVFGDGSVSRDFTFVDNVVQANVLAACAPPADLANGVFNVACGRATSLVELYAMIRGAAAAWLPSASDKMLRSEAARPGDIHRSCANVDRARGHLGYRPTVAVGEGLARTVRWYAERALRGSLAGTTDAYLSGAP